MADKIKGAKGKASRILVWIVMLLLIVGLAGFGATNFGGTTTTVASVGSVDISADRYARALQQELRSVGAQTGQPVTMEQARRFGLDRLVLQRLITSAALEAEAQQIGLSVGDEAVAEQIRQVQAFQGMDGAFSRESYQMALDRAGLSMSDFEGQIRDETARTLLQNALVAGIRPPQAYVDTLLSYQRQTRDLTLVRYGPDALEDSVGAPSSEQIQAFYEANEDLFTLPRRKALTFIQLTPDMMLDEVEVPEETLRELYVQRADQFDQPARRLVERLVFNDMAAAQEAAAAIESGETSFDALIEERGLSFSDVDLGEVSQDDLGAAGEAVFALDGPGIAGPAESDLGPALYHVNAVLQAQTVPFEEVRADLRDEAAAGAAERAVQAQYESVQDLLAGGATLEEIADETPFALGEMTWRPDESGTGIGAYQAFRQAAAGAEPGDFPEIAELSDGGLFALRVDEVLEPTLQPLSEVEERAVAGWQAQTRRERLTEQAEEGREALASGTAPSELGGRVIEATDLRRDGFIENTPEGLIQTAFEMEEGATQVVPTEDGAVLLRVDAVNTPSDTGGEAQQARAQLRQSIAQSIGQDATIAFTNTVQGQMGVQVNQQALETILSQAGAGSVP